MSAEYGSIEEGHLHGTVLGATNQNSIAGGITLPHHVAFALEIVFFAYVFLAAYPSISLWQMGIMFMLPVILVFWFGQVSHLALDDGDNYFLRESFLKSYPITKIGLPVILVQLIFSFALWPATKAMLNYLPQYLFVAIQILRMQALVGLLKWRKGTFPTAIAWLTSFPDTLYGLSAVVVLVFYPALMSDNMFLALWNLAGCLIILPLGGLVHQFGMKPTQFYVSRVPNSVTFEYPAILGVAIVVPILVTWNTVITLWIASGPKA